MSESTVALELFLRWLNEAHERRFSLPEGADGSAVSFDGETRLAVEVRPLLGVVEDDAWVAARARLEELLGEGLPGAYALWAPFGAVLPAGEPMLSEFIDGVRQAAVKLGPQERSYVALPARMVLRKISDEGGVVSVTGGLNQHWARFTELVRGTYDLDSTAVHRLPESEAHLEELIERVVGVTKQLSAGQRAEIDTTDAWTLQRLAPTAPPVRLSPEATRSGEKPYRREGESDNSPEHELVAGAGGVTIVGAPPTQSDDPGLAVRRNFRRILAEAGPSLRSAEADPSTGSGRGMRALVLLGHYARMDQEGATTAMRGYDPALYSGIDFVCLVADGLVKPIIDSPVRAKR